MELGGSDKDYIDIDDAIKRVGGNRGLYIKLLGRFIDGNHMDTLESAIQSGNMEEAANLAHTLKGVSANLSLAKVTSISTDLEQALKSGNDHSAFFADLKLAYKTTADMIAEISG